MEMSNHYSHTKSARCCCAGRVQPTAYFPSTPCSAVVGEGVTDPGVDVVQAQLPLRCSCYCHRNQSGVAVGGFPFAVRGGGLRHMGQKVCPLPAPVFFLFPLHCSSCPLSARAQAADSQLRQPVNAGETGVQLRRHLLFFPSLSIQDLNVQRREY